MTRRAPPHRRAGAAVAALGMAAVVLVTAHPVLADSPLDTASRAAEQVPFSGRLRLEWHDDQGVHATEVNIHSGSGELRIEGPSVLVATTNHRYVVSGSGWDLLSPGDPSALGPIPPLTAKYQVIEAQGPEMLGRSTIQVSLGDAQRPAERLYLDKATNLLLRQEEFDGSGEPVRAVYFVRLSLGATAAMPKPARTVDDLGRRIGANSLPAPFIDPAQLAAGYRRVGVLNDDDGIQVVYSDGLHGLSVFERMGSLDPRSLPGAGVPVRIGRWIARRYVWAGGQLVVWQERGATYTAVGDAPAAEVLAAIDELPAARRGSPLQRLRHACRRLVQAVSGTW